MKNTPLIKSVKTLLSHGVSIGEQTPYHIKVNGTQGKSAPKTERITTVYIFFLQLNLVILVPGIPSSV
ncbi:MAG: hypothetical protein RSB78_05265, partial [Oscillospiraceae bacterium]